MMGVFPEMPPQLRTLFPQFFWNWWQSFSVFITTSLSTRGDITMSTSGRGIVLTNAAGTVTKRVRLNDLGDGIIIEDL